MPLIQTQSVGDKQIKKNCVHCPYLIVAATVLAVPRGRIGGCGWWGSRCAAVSGPILLVLAGVVGAVAGRIGWGGRVGSSTTRTAVDWMGGLWTGFAVWTADTDVVSTSPSFLAWNTKRTCLLLTQRRQTSIHRVGTLVYGGSPHLQIQSPPNVQLLYMYYVKSNGKKNCQTTGFWGLLLSILIKKLATKF